MKKSGWFVLEERSKERWLFKIRKSFLSPINKQGNKVTYTNVSKLLRVESARLGLGREADNEGISCWL